jgi:recombination protein RecR
MYPKALQKIIEHFQKLPGIGEKTAERLALHMATQFEADEVLNFADDLIVLKNELKSCKICHMITDQEVCSVCRDQSRDQKTLMVVADAKDVFVMEKMKTYRGLYHVLGGLVDFSRGITDKDLNIETLSHRVKDITEMILATSGTVEGETTAKYLKALYDHDGLKVTRLAYGLPVGADLKYADELTLSKAVENRQKY